MYYSSCLVYTCVDRVDDNHRTPLLNETIYLSKHYFKEAAAFV